MKVFIFAVFLGTLVVLQVAPSNAAPYRGQALSQRESDEAVDQLLSAMMASVLEDEMKGQAESLLRAVVMANTGSNEAEMQFRSFLNTLRDRFSDRAQEIGNNIADRAREIATEFLDGRRCRSGFLCNVLRDSTNNFLRSNDGAPGSIVGSIRNGANRFLASTPSPDSEPEDDGIDRLGAELMQLQRSDEDNEALRKLAGILMSSWKQEHN